MVAVFSCFVSSSVSLCRTAAPRNFLILEFNKTPTKSSDCVVCTGAEGQGPTGLVWALVWPLATDLAWPLGPGLGPKEGRCHLQQHLHLDQAVHGMSSSMALVGFYRE